MAALMLTLVLVGGTTFAGCSSGQGVAGGADMATTVPGMAGGAPAGDAAAAPATATMGDQGQVAAGAPDDLMPADASAAWASRPAFTRVDPQTEEAYAYALYHPQVIEWMPCYCGCVAMDHRSNLDCYLKRPVAGSPTTFEEHASYCNLCVKTTLLAKQLISEGKSLRDIRAAVDQTFGGSAPGTPTQLPPA